MRIISLRRSAWVVLLMLEGILGHASSTEAQPAPALTNVPPVYLKQGESQELTLTGQNLGGVSSVAVADPRGVVAALLDAEELTPEEKAKAAAEAKARAAAQPKAPPKPAAKPGKKGAAPAAPKAAKTDSKARVKLTAAPDAPLGVRELRLVTPTGVTAPLVVTVGAFPVVADKEPNNAPEQAQPVALPAAIGGRIDTGGDADCFKFDAKKGQHLLFDVYAARLGSPLEPVVTVYDATGKELPHAEEFHGGDPMAVFDAPADGSYVLQIRDLQYRGGGDYGYRVDAGPIPYVESLVPMSGRRGQKVEVTAVGHNLAGGEKFTLDLAGAEPGPMPVRAKTAAGLSNEVPFVVTDIAQVAEQEPNDTPQQATPVPLPSEVTGVLQKPGDEDYFKFQVSARQEITVEVQARRTGSPVDALLTLKTAKGDLVEQTNGTADAEARISKPLEPGEYVASVRDLTYAGGPGYGYRLIVSQAGGLPPDFTVRFLPDAPRVARGGNTKLWCEVVRANGYKGEVTVSVEGLPAGVTTSGPVVLDEKASGVFTLSAAPDAALGAAPIKLRATGSVGGQEVSRTGEPELNGRPLQQAYLTVLEPGPITVEAVALVKPEQLKDYSRQVAELYARVNAPSAQLDAAQAEWEKQASGAVKWKVLQPEKLASAANTPLAKQPDDSVLAGGKPPEKDTYTVTATTDVKGITAIRLEVFTDPSLPQTGPGRGPDNGNFVLTKFAATIAPKSDPSKAQPVAFSHARATFEQENYPIANAVIGGTPNGWGISPETARPQAAVFFCTTPLNPAGASGFEDDALLTFTLEQQFGFHHTVGRFRLSVTTDPEAGVRADKPVPAPILALINTPAGDRSPEQKLQLAAYYRTVAPELAADRAKLDALRSSVGPYAEIARLEALLSATTPELDAERKKWEDSALNGGWVPADVVEMKSAGGTLLVKEADGSVAATGASPPTDTYTITATAPLKQVTAIRLEALPDERFTNNGPGRGPDGNFVLTRVKLSAAARAPGGKTGAAAPVELRSAKATFEQKDRPASAALDDDNHTGWSVAPHTGRPASAVFTAAAPVKGGAAGAALTLVLEQQSDQPQNTLGRFRVWVTGAADPGAASTLPPERRVRPAHPRRQAQRRPEGPPGRLLPLDRPFAGRGPRTPGRVEGPHAPAPADRRPQQVRPHPRARHPRRPLHRGRPVDARRLRHRPRPRHAHAHADRQEPDARAGDRGGDSRSGSCRSR